MATDGFKSAGLGLMNVADEYARKGMAGSSDRKGEFLGGLLSFLGVGENTIQGVKDFRNNPIGSIQNAIAPKVGPGYGALANTGPLISNEGIEKGGGFNPAGIVPPTMQQSTTGVPPVVGATPAVGAPVVNDPLRLQQEETERIRNSLIPRNL